jgi:hypothetical protein
LWAPLVDRFRPPFAGRRRGWIILFQLALGAALVALGALSPRATPLAFAALAVGVTFCAASQDIAADAYRTDLLAATSAPPAPPSTSSATAPPRWSPAGWRSSPPITCRSAASTSSARCSSPSASSPRSSRPSPPP